ncbi:hypothetical protein F5Y16DRAFT_393586 [Xylariaceae sp. FL0255]|nr:hypothetical protein F5Y16DRAFT_393586 [Xylariaceae sp. FL0255]
MSPAYSIEGVAQTRAAPTQIDQAAIPLVCHVCPKHGNFSDLSHLLTHISSKGHLHNQFQLTLTRSVDEEAEIALTDFDAWFSHYNIAELLRARKSAKDYKDNQQRRSQGRTSSRGKGSSRSQRGGRKTARVARASQGGNKPATKQAEEPAIIKIEEDDGDENEIENENDLPEQNHTDSYGWRRDYLFSEPSSLRPSASGQYNDYVDVEEESSKYDQSDLYGPFGSEDTVETIEDDTRILVLKGVVYPGMAGFDAATEHDRKMRNQKKDPAVVMKLQTNSLFITRDEEVWDRNFEWQRTRDVYDDPSEDGSMDEDDVDEKARAKRTRVKRENGSATSVRQRRSNPRSRQATNVTGKTRTQTRTSSRTSRVVPDSPVAHSAQALRRTTRSTANRQAQLPLHNHGIHSQADGIHSRDQTVGDEGVPTLSLSMPNSYLDAYYLDVDPPAEYSYEDYHDPDELENLREACLTALQALNRGKNRDEDRLALRPGNPNAAFASTVHGFRKSPSRFPGKENNRLVLKSPSSSSNPYLRVSGDSIDNNNYNPLYVQPRDGYGYRLYPAYDDEPKTSATSSFHPINGNAMYDSTHASGLLDATYHRNRSGGDDYGV